MPSESLLNRRLFLQGMAGATASLAVSQSPAFAMAAPSPLAGRFITFVSVVRVNQIEVTPQKSIGEDEVQDNTPAKIQARRDAFTKGSPDGKMTWAISWLALTIPASSIRTSANCSLRIHDKYGDEITFIPGGYFAPMYDTRADTRKTMHEALQMISKMVGNGYRPQCAGGRIYGCGKSETTSPPKKAFTFARGRYGASTASTTAMATAASVIPTIPAASIT